MRLQVNTKYEDPIYTAHAALLVVAGGILVGCAVAALLVVSGVI